MSGITTISAERFADLDQAKSVDLIDVRTPMEFRHVRAASARSVPLDSLDPNAVMEERNGTANEPLYVICHAGSRGGKACQKFIDVGYQNVVNVEGGTKAWEAAGLPVVREKKAISLERQVRVVAGLLVMLGAVLGLLVAPHFIAVAAFVGAGLVFAGITDTCGMAMLLAKMPWNRVKAEGDGVLS